MRRSSVALALLAALCAAGARAEDASEGLFARLETSRGALVARLEPSSAPLAVTAFVGLAEGTVDGGQGAGRPFYDGRAFYLVMPGLVVETGCPRDDGSGGPGFELPDEPDANLRHDAQGVLTMCTRGPDTNGSRFALTLRPMPWLDGHQTVFGRVVEGAPALERLEAGDRLLTVRIERRGAAARGFLADRAALDRRLAEARLRRASTEEERRATEAAQAAARYPSAVELSGGLRYVVARRGRQGPAVAPGASVKVRYATSLLDGRLVDESREGGRPLEFRVGAGQVLAALERGVVGMTQGERRTLIAPPSLAFGERGVPGLVPPGATVVIEVRLLALR